MGMYAFSKRNEAVAKAERKEAVAKAVVATEVEGKKKLEAAADRAKKDKERSVNMAVKKALAEAQKGGDE